MKTATVLVSVRQIANFEVTVLLTTLEVIAQQATKEAIVQIANK